MFSAKRFKQGPYRPDLLPHIAEKAVFERAQPLHLEYVLVFCKNSYQETMLYFGTEVLEVFLMMKKLYHPSVMKFLHCWESGFWARTTAPSWIRPRFLQKFLLRDNALLWYWSLRSIFNDGKALSSISYEILTLLRKQFSCAHNRSILNVS